MSSRGGRPTEKDRLGFHAIQPTLPRLHCRSVTNGALEILRGSPAKQRVPCPATTTAPTTWKSIPSGRATGKEILFISNRDHIHGTGGFWLMKAEPGAEAREIHYEETSWKSPP